MEIHRLPVLRQLALVTVLGLLVPRPGPALEPEHGETRNLMDFVERAAAVVAERGPAACDELKKEAWRKGDVYAFVIDLEGNATCNPARPDLEGKSVLELRDPDGKPIIQLFLRQVRGDSRAGWVHYLWPRPGQTVLHWKSSYLRRVSAGGRDYVVGAGAYQLPMEKLFVVERVDEAVDLLRERGEEAFATLRDKAGGFIFLDTYVFVMNDAGIMRVNPKFPDMEGKRVLDIQDEAGAYPGREILAAVESRDSAWVAYLWPRPNEARASRKETYVRRVRVGDETLIVASGVYFDG